MRERDYLRFLNLLLEITLFIFLRIKWPTKEDNGWEVANS